ncbi:MAG: hypothetical protein AB8I08_32345 [Sandaracinaceae bacterium]
MADRLPEELQAYIDRLPGGLDAYPDHRSKASVLRAFLDGHDMDALRAALPAELAALADPKTAVTTWLPEVHLNAVMLARRAVFFDSDEAFVEDAAKRNRQLIESPLYRMLIKFFSTERVGAMGRTVFHQMHDGIELEIHPGTPMRWALRYPPHLMPELVARCYATAATVALELGGTRVTTEVVAFDEAHFMMEFRPLDP